MLENIDVLRMARTMAAHAGHRQALVARNVANAETPGYKAVDLTPFADIHAGTASQMTRTRTGHVWTDRASGSRPGWAVQADTRTAPSPDGNTVTLEHEMLRMVEVRQQHDLALSIYRSTLGVLRSSLGQGR